MQQYYNIHRHGRASGPGNGRHHDPGLPSAPSQNLTEDVSTGRKELRLSAPNVDCRYAWHLPALVRHSHAAVGLSTAKLKYAWVANECPWVREGMEVTLSALSFSPMASGGMLRGEERFHPEPACEWNCILVWSWLAGSMIFGSWRCFTWRPSAPALSTLQPGRASRHPILPISLWNIVGVLGISQEPVAGIRFRCKDLTRTIVQATSSEAHAVRSCKFEAGRIMVVAIPVCVRC